MGNEQTPEIEISTRILIVEDHPLIRQAIASLLDAEPDFQVCGEAEDAPASLSAIETRNVELVILDVSLKDSDGFSILREIKARFPKVKVLVFSAHDESAYALRAMQAGASGYLTKGEPHVKLLLALRTIKAGGVYFSENLEQQFLHRHFQGAEAATQSPVDLLTNRELEVFRLIGQGLRTGEIAAKLSVANTTVEAHRAHIKQKFGFETWNELMRCAVEWSTPGSEPMSIKAHQN